MNAGSPRSTFSTRANKPAGRPRAVRLLLACVALTTGCTGSSGGRSPLPVSVPPGPSRSAAVVDVGVCQLATTPRDPDLPVVALDCPGRPAVALPVPFGVLGSDPHGLPAVPGWTVIEVLYVGGEARVWAHDTTRTCMLITDAGSAPIATRVSCTPRTTPAPSPRREPRRILPRPPTATVRTASVQSTGRAEAR